MDACGKPTLEQAPGGICDPVEKGTHAGTGLLAGIMTPEGTHTRAICEELQPMGRAPFEGDDGELPPLEGEECESPPLEEGGGIEEM